ncbi:hypothetical protein EAT51_19480 [Pseudoxanthomonas winnipegensis]|uniref:ESPR-type extended signal peptide-containing protein n=1 Tax=Pseudoxanthomonas winnipegensis TaxID=2480810 RepID=UPI00102DBA1F|nr:ESPR-type extended signal peptide-containing protein [Pseudoxanthomonas winnipegensis]TAA36557.1 hypothetical protein EAT51_19480 [Pseudoxanthomonas winnipegensis]
MNKIYRKVWSRARAQVVVASELASGSRIGVISKGSKSSPVRVLMLATLAYVGWISQGLAQVTISGGGPASLS